MELPSSPSWAALLKYLSHLHKELAEQVWRAETFEAVQVLKAQKKILDTVERCPEDIKKLVKDLKGDDNEI